MKKVCENIRTSLPAFQKSSFDNHSKAVEKYLSYFDFNYESSRHRVGFVKSDSRQIFLHYIEPKPSNKSRGTVIFSHGYLCHSGIYSRFADFLIKHNYSVLLWDLPGHGLSDGKRAYIGEFKEYAAVLADIIDTASDLTSQPISLVGHSTGCSAILQYLHDQEDHRISNVVLLAPLIRSYAWHLSRVGTDVGSLFTDRIWRAQRRVTHDSSFQRFLEVQDPLRIATLPYAWVDALEAWNRNFREWEQSELPFTVIQGTDDTVVDWKYNLKQIKKKYPNADIHRIDGGLHQLLNESPSIRQKVYQIIMENLLFNCA